MKYISLDIESTCLTPSPDNLLMVSMVLEDTNKPNVSVEQLPHFTCFVKQPEPFTGSYVALKMNDWILDVLYKKDGHLAAKYPVFRNYPKHIQSNSNNPHGVAFVSDNWVDHCLAFLSKHFDLKKDRINAAGKNVAGFDIQFMPEEIKKLFRYRVIDVGSMFVDFSKDKAIPDLKECKERAGIMTPVAHDAREDAMDVIRLIRFKINPQEAKKVEVTDLFEV